LGQRNNKPSKLAGFEGFKSLVATSNFNNNTALILLKKPELCKQIANDWAFFMAVRKLKSEASAWWQSHDGGAALFQSPPHGLLNGADEVGLMHRLGDQGHVALLILDGSGTREGRKQFDSSPAHIKNALASINTSENCYYTMNRFQLWGRKAVNFAEAGSLFVDLDSYHMPWAAGRSKDALKDSAMWFCEEAGLPPPSILNNSGRGMQAKWLLDSPVSTSQLALWNECQKVLVGLLAEAGADPQARDVSRVLRIPSTTNKKSGEVCQVMHLQEDEGAVVRYSFDDMVELLLPLIQLVTDQAEVREVMAQQASAKRVPVKHRTALNLVAPDYTAREAFKKDIPARQRGLRRCHAGQLSWDRLNDLRKLVKMRGAVKEGDRMKTLFWQVNFMLLSGQTCPNRMEAEARELAYQIDPKWNAGAGSLCSLLERAQAHARGEKVVFNGELTTPLYTPKNERLINDFAITLDEQRQLTTIICETVKAERKKVANATRHAMSREEYLSASHQKREQARELRDKGMTQQAIADEIGVSLRSVKGWLKSA
jgi:hypothetical protein